MASFGESSNPPQAEEEDDEHKDDDAPAPHNNVGADALSPQHHELDLPPRPSPIPQQQFRAPHPHGDVASPRLEHPNPPPQAPPPHDAPVNAAPEDRRSCSETIFPMKLYDILCNPNFAHAIAWCPHGRSWRVLNKDYFMEEICPQYFAQTRYESFIRQVNGWGFKRMRREGPDRSSYYHENFLRGFPYLIEGMRRPQPGEKTRDTREEPDFYAMPPLPSLQTPSLVPVRHSVKVAKSSRVGRPAGSSLNGSTAARGSSFEAVPPRSGEEYPPPPPGPYPNYMMPPGGSPYGPPPFYPYGPPPPGYYGPPPPQSGPRGPPPPPGAPGHYPYPPSHFALGWGPLPHGGPPMGYPPIYDPYGYPPQPSTPQRGRPRGESTSTPSGSKRDREENHEEDEFPKRYLPGSPPHHPMANGLHPPPPHPMPNGGPPPPPHMMGYYYPPHNYMYPGEMTPKKDEEGDDNGASYKHGPPPPGAGEES